MMNRLRTFFLLPFLSFGVSVQSQLTLEDSPAFEHSTSRSEPARAVDAFPTITSESGEAVREVENDTSLFRLFNLEDSLNDLNNQLETEAPKKDPGRMGHWKGSGFGTVMLTTRPEEHALGGMDLLESPFGLQTGNALSSWSIQVNPFEYRYPIIGDAFGITTGLGFDWLRFKVNPQTVLSRTEDGALAVATDSVYNVSRNYLSLTYVRIPLLFSLRTQSDPKAAFHLEAGVVGGIHLHNQYIRKYSDAESKYAYKVKGFGMNPLQLNARLALGYGEFSVFTEVPFRPLWNESAIGDNPRIYPMTIGVIFSDFD